MPDKSSNISLDMDQKLSLPQHRPHVTEFLKFRRSNLAKLMIEPGPDAAQLDDMLEIAARVPDHRKLAPWRFILFQGDARAKFGPHLASAFTKANPNLPVDRAVFESARMTRAPLVVAVISSVKICARGTPKWEQKLSAGAVCFNLCLAAQSFGFGAQWLTEWYAYNDDINAALGLSENETVAGYIYIGSVDTAPSPRARPDMSQIVSRWTG
ncbi:MAG: nitroreductase [Litorimonas sp.]